MKKASDKKPPRSARKKAVPMKFVTALADFANGKCMYAVKYLTRLLAFARNAKFSSTSTPENPGIRRG